MGDLIQATPSRVWCSTAEAATAIGKSVDTLNRWAKERRIPDEMIRELPRGFLWHLEWLASPIVFKFPQREEPETSRAPGVVSTGTPETA